MQALANYWSRFYRENKTNFLPLLAQAVLNFSPGTTLIPQARRF